MDPQASDAPTARFVAVDGTPRGAGPEPEHDGDWLVLRNCPLGGEGPRVDLVLLHPGVGVALVDFASKDTDAVGRFRGALDGRRFPAIFGGYPPVARAILPADRLPDLGRVLAEEFKAHPPLSLAGGDAWIRSARAAIEAEAPVRAPDPLRPRRSRAFPWRPAVLAAAAGGLVGLFVAVLAPLGRGPESPAGPAGTTAVAPGTGTDGALAGAEPGNGGLTASDVRAALASADPAIGPGAEAAPEPQEAGNAATVPPVSGGRPDEVPEPVRTAALPPPDPQPASVAEPSPDAPVAAASEPPPVPTAPEATAAPPEPERPPAAVAAAGGAHPEPPPPAPVGGGPAPRPSPSPAGKAYQDTPGAAVDPRLAPKRPAVPPEAAPRPATQTAATGGRRTALPNTPAEPGGGGRCGAVLARAMVGGTLSDDDRDYLRRGCDRRG